MATYTLTWTIKAPDDANANAILSDCDDFVGSFAEGSGDRAVTGCKVFGGGVVRILNENVEVV